MYVSPTHSVYLHVLNRIPWRYLYMPGLYLLGFGAFTFIIGIRLMRVQEYPAWSFSLSNYMVFFMIGLVLYSAPLFLVGWYMLKDSQFADPHKMQPNLDDAGKYVENILRKVVLFIPWNYAYIPGMAMFALSFAVIAHAMNLHQTGLDATEWATAICLRSYLVFAILLNVAGLIVCMGWYLFRGLEVDGAGGVQQENTLDS